MLGSLEPNKLAAQHKKYQRRYHQGLNDPSPTAREIAKRAYTAFELHSPEDAQALVAALDKRALSKLNSVHSSKSLKSKGRKSSKSGSFSSSIKSHRRPSSLDSTLICGHESVDQGQDCWLLVNLPSPTVKGSPEKSHLPKLV